MIGATGKAGRKEIPASAVTAASATDEERRSASGTSQRPGPLLVSGIAPRVGRSCTKASRATGCALKGVSSETSVEDCMAGGGVDWGSICKSETERGLRLSAQTPYRQQLWIT